MQALWYTHQSASTGRHQDLHRCHRHARRHARISTTSTDSSRSSRAPSACQKPRWQPMIESTRAASGASAVDRCEIITDHGPGEASDLLRGGLGGPGLGLDVLEDCAPSAALLLLVGHDFPDSEALLATRGAHLPEAGVHFSLFRTQYHTTREREEKIHPPHTCAFRSQSIL